MVDDYSDIDFMLVNGYLYYVFIEYFFVLGIIVYKKYCCFCCFNFESIFCWFFFILLVNMEMIVVLIFGVS